MLQLNAISLTRFKNYGQRAFDFEARVVGICGRNGIGKTNLLDAIYYLCFTKSYFARADQQHVKEGYQGFRIEGKFDKNSTAQQVACILRENGKKECWLNEEQYEKFAHHIGRFPCVLIAPDDVQIITGGSEERRRYIDALLCQVDSDYLQQLVDYNRVLQQRNSYLKSLAERRAFDKSLLDIYDDQLISHGNYIYTRRSSFLQDLVPAIETYYRQIADAEEGLELVYESQLQEHSFDHLLRRAREKDLLLQRTTTGVHKDDLTIRLQQKNFKQIASQGQRKSLLFALRLAEFSSLQTAKGFAPLLLLDDVFEKLDAGRMHNLLHRVCIENDGQVFLTDTHCQRLKDTLQQLQVSFQLIDLDDTLTT